MSLTDLYREVILDHFRSPRNKGTLDAPDHHGEGTNPLCGDEIQIDLAVTDGVVSDVRIDGQGCSISQASASMMTEAIKGKSIDDIRSLADTFTHLMTDDDAAILDPERPGAVLGDLEALQGVREFPVRIKCATLSWHTMLDALAD
ncbi:MAG: SUF system NifU family Fe-S cluster assembly protein [Acidimicrobiia bacterium]|nr:SUF system NifU family Fe-S cluster assembly protein [Acidimicrobiia bacterium]